MTWQICKDPIDVTISSLACVTITLLGILRRNTSPTPIGLYLMVLKDMVEILLKMMADFLQCTISLITSAKMLHKSVALSPS